MPDCEKSLKHKYYNLLAPYRALLRRSNRGNTHSPSKSTNSSSLLRDSILNWAAVCLPNPTLSISLTSSFSLSTLITSRFLFLLGVVKPSGSSSSALLSNFLGLREPGVLGVFGVLGVLGTLPLAPLLEARRSFWKCWLDGVSWIGCGGLNDNFKDYMWGNRD